MKLRNFFYLLLALPLLFAACDKESTGKHPNKPAEYVIDKDLILGIGTPGFSEGGIILSFKDLDNEFGLVLNLNDVGDNNILEAGTYTVANKKFEPLGTIISYVGNSKPTISFHDGDGTIVVEGDVNNYKIDILLTDAQKRRYHFTFEGKIYRMGPSGELPTEPVNTTAAQLEGYSLQLPEVSEYNIYLYDKPLKENGLPQANCGYYSVNAFNIASEEDAEGYVTIPEGTYTFDKDNKGAALTLYTHPNYVLLNEDGTEYHAMVTADDGELVVTADGITLTAIIGGVKHTITYNGVPKLKVEQAMSFE